MSLHGVSTHSPSFQWRLDSKWVIEIERHLQSLELSVSFCAVVKMNKDFAILLQMFATCLLNFEQLSAVLIVESHISCGFCTDCTISGSETSVNLRERRCNCWKDLRECPQFYLESICIVWLVSRSRYADFCCSKSGCFHDEYIWVHEHNSNHVLVPSIREYAFSGISVLLILCGRSHRGPNCGTCTLLTCFVPG